MSKLVQPLLIPRVYNNNAAASASSLTNLSKLREARSRGDLEQVKILLNKPFIRSNFLNAILLDVAQFEKNPDIATYFFELPDISINGNAYDSLLMRSIAGNNKVTFELLMHHKDIDINKEVGGEAPIVTAVRLHRDEFIERLLARPEIQINDQIIQKFTDAGKTSFLLRHQLPVPMLTRVLGNTRMTVPSISNALRNRTWARRRHAVQAWAEAHAPQTAEEDTYGLQYQAAHLREQLASPALSATQKAGIAARARAINKKANNLTRNSRKSSRRRSTRKAHKY